MDTPARPYSTAAGLLAVAVGAVLFSLAFWATSEGGPAPVHWPELFQTPTHLTLLFALPPCLYWMRTGRLKTPGVLFLILGMTLVHWAAMSQAVGVGVSPRADHLEVVIAGATGGAIGSVGTWLLLMLMSPAFRTGRAAAVMAVAAVLLTAIGAYGVGVGSPSNLAALLSGKPFEGAELEPAKLVVALYLPWQLVYGAAMVVLFKAK
jgi:hypothetical protein